MLISTTAVTVEERTGVGMMIKKTRGTAVFHQETISVSSMRLVISVRQEYYYPGTKRATITVLAVQSSTTTTANMTASLELTRPKKMKRTLISTRTYKTALVVMVVIVVIVVTQV